MFNISVLQWKIKQVLFRTYKTQNSPFKMHLQWLYFLKMTYNFYPGNDALLLYSLSSVMSKGHILLAKIYVKHKYDPEYSTNV